MAEPKQKKQADAGLTAEQYKRYSRHLILPEIGVAGQKKLLEAKVLLVGMGGLGSPLGVYLAAAGVGNIGIVDFDVVDYSNLQRQIIYGTSDVGKPKLEVAAQRLRDINTDVKVKTYETRLTSENALDIIREYDIVIDGTDNFPTRYLVNDACVLLKKTNIYGSIFKFEGQATVFAPQLGGPCYRCLYPEPPPPGFVPSCAEGGVVGILPGTIAMIQATEAVKLITGQGEPLVGRLILYNSLKMQFKELKLKKDPNCPICGPNPKIKELIDYNEFCGVGRGEEAMAAAELDALQISPVDVKLKMDRKDDFFLLDVREPTEYEIARIEGATLIPLGELPHRLEEIAKYKNKEVVTHCKLGGRSLRALEILKANGFQNVRSMYGGIDLWAVEVDPSVPRY